MNWADWFTFALLGTSVTVGLAQMGYGAMKVYQSSSRNGKMLVVRHAQWMASKDDEFSFWPMKGRNCNKFLRSSNSSMRQNENIYLFTHKSK